METNSRHNIFWQWAVWHFYEMPKFLFGIWKNYILFSVNYFSLIILARSLFSPWRKYRWAYPNGFDIVEFFNTAISNTVSRILGAVMRILLIVAGIFFQIFVIIAGILIFLAWILMPFYVLAGCIFFLFY